MRDLVRDTYAEAGRPSLDPVVFFKLQLVMFFEGLRSERQLMRVVSDRLSLRWYLGYERRRIYAAPAAACAACALRPQCTPAQRRRRIGRSLDAASLELVRGYHDTEEYARAMRERKVWVEPLFAEAKDWHGLRRFRLRSLENVNGEALLIAAGQNVKRLLSRWGWGRCPFPTGTAGVVLSALPPLPPLMP